MNKRNLILASLSVMVLASVTGLSVMNRANAHEGHDHGPAAVAPASPIVTTSNGWMTEAGAVALPQTSADRPAQQNAEGSTYLQESTPRSFNKTGAGLNQTTGATLN